MTRMTLDFETRSEADLRRVGAWAYAEHPSTEIICASWALGDYPVERWINQSVVCDFEEYGGNAGDLEPLWDLLEDSEVEVEAHNAAFEYSLIHANLAPRRRWPTVDLRRWRDTMAVACYYALPGQLDRLCKTLGLPGKDPEGGRLITKYSKLHLKTATSELPWSEALRFSAYCDQDTDQEREVGNLLGDLPEDEEEIFLHDFMVAARGMLMDRPGILAAQRLVERYGERLAEEFRELTGLNPGQRDEVLRWLRGHDLPGLENLQRGTLEDLLEGDDLPEDTRRALELRVGHSHTSTTKLDAMARQAGADGRARFQTRYHGAITGRNTGAGFQPLNLVRSWDHVSPECLISDIELGDLDWLRALYGDPMEAVSKALRHYIKAGEGRRIIAGDFTSIEAVVLACLAGEEWKVEAFRDRKPVYEIGACQIYKWPEERAYDPNFKKKWPDERQDGKVRELACGYQGSVGAWRKFDSSDRHTDEAVRDMVQSWRDDHPMVVALWRALEDAAMREVTSPRDGPHAVGWYDGSCVVAGEEARAEIDRPGGFGFEVVDGWLTIVLPDGKRLWYWRPEVRLKMPPWHDPIKHEDCASGDCDHEPRPQVSYLGYKNKQLRRIYGYGGHWTDNLVQGTSRQLLKPCELALEARDYPVVLSVYDEVVCDVPNGYGSADEFGKIVAEVVAGLEWARGWPVRMPKPWEGKRYRK